MKYSDHTANNLVKKQKDGTWKSPSQLLQGFRKPYSAKLMLPFGCFVIVQLPKAQRKGRKHPSRESAWPGIFIGYGDDIGYGGSYLIWNAETRQARPVSYNFCVADETNFPWNTHPVHRDDWARHPMSYKPTREAMLDPEESQLYNFNDEERNEVLDSLFGADVMRGAPRRNADYSAEPAMDFRDGMRIPAVDSRHGAELRDGADIRHGDFRDGAEICHGDFEGVTELTTDEGASTEHTASPEEDYELEWGLTPPRRRSPAPATKSLRSTRMMTSGVKTTPTSHHTTNYQCWKCSIMMWECVPEGMRGCGKRKRTHLVLKPEMRILMELSLECL